MIPENIRMYKTVFDPDGQFCGFVICVQEIGDMRMRALRSRASQSNFDILDASRDVRGKDQDAEYFIPATPDNKPIIEDHIKASNLHPTGTISLTK